MKHILMLSLLLVTFCLSGCGNSQIENRVWQGELCRTADGEKLSDVCLKLSGDSLYIYANAIFGAENEQLIHLRRRDGADEYARNEQDLNSPFALSVDYAADKTSGEETLTIRGADFQMCLTPSAERNFTQEMLSFYKHRTVPRDAALYFTGRWQGKITRTRDNQRLSDICLEYSGDTLKVYSNAIFGKANEKLCCVGFADNAYVYTNANGEEFHLSPIQEKDGLRITGVDFQMKMKPLQNGWEEALKFYQKREVSRNADEYLFGTYRGKTKMHFIQAEFLGLVMGQKPGLMNAEISMSINFLEGNSCKVTIETTFTSPEMKLLLAFSGSGSRDLSVETYTYKISGNKLQFGKNTAYIQQDGSLLLQGEIRKQVEVDNLVLRQQ